MYRNSLFTLIIVLVVSALSLSMAGATALSVTPGVQDEQNASQAELGTAFTYQGRLTQGGSAASGNFDFEFRIFDALANGNQIGGTITQGNVVVSNGLFTTKLDFGAGVFTGDARYLQIGVRDGTSTGVFTQLTPRQELTPTPYALFAANAFSATTALSATSAANAWALTGNGGTDPAINFLGTIDDAALEVRVNNTRTLRIETQSDPLFGTVPSLTGGYSGNSINPNAVGGTIAGGGAVQDDGDPNDASNQVPGSFGAIGGGTTNLAGSWATVAGGKDNQAPSSFSAISGGEDNTASGGWSIVPGGQFCTAEGEHSLAAGYGASALHAGAFVWGDASGAGGNSLNVVESTEANQFLVHANGGAIFLKRSTFPDAPTGSIGVGAMHPILVNAALQVENGTGTGEAGWLYTESASNPAAVLKLLKAPTGANYFLQCENFAVAFKCHIDANGTFVAGSDFAESLAATGGKQGYEPGDVLILSPAEPMGVEKATQPYDTRVAGVYSTRPGLLGANKDGETWVADDEIPVGIVGIVPTKVTTANGPIAVGDLLTTSSLPGHAMRADPITVEGYEFYPTGTILGKALEPLESGTGMIEVLVTLH